MLTISHSSCAKSSHPSEPVESRSYIEIKEEYDIIKELRNKECLIDGEEMEREK